MAFRNRIGASLEFSTQIATNVEHVFAGIAVTDYRAARRWYEALFGRPPDVVVHEEEAMWQIVERAWIYVVRDPERAGRGLVTILVSNLDRQLSALASRGMAASEVETVPGKYRKAAFTDPEGNMLSFGESLAAESSDGGI